MHARIKNKRENQEEIRGHHTGQRWLVAATWRRQSKWHRSNRLTVGVGVDAGSQTSHLKENKFQVKFSNTMSLGKVQCFPPEQQVPRALFLGRRVRRASLPQALRFHHSLVNSRVGDGKGIGYCVPKPFSKPSPSPYRDSAPFSPASLSSSFRCLGKSLNVFSSGPLTWERLWRFNKMTKATWNLFPAQSKHQIYISCYSFYYHQYSPCCSGSQYQVRATENILKNAPNSGPNHFSSSH